MSRYSDILDAVEAKLALITLANGYNTDAGLHLHRNREFQLSPPDKPALVFWPGQRTDTYGGDTPPSLGEENHFLPFKIEGYIDATERGEEGEHLLADILKALKVDQYFGNLTEGYQSGLTGTVTLEENGDGGLLGYVTVEGNIFYVTMFGVE